MRILYIVHQFYPEFHSGTEKFLFNLASNLQRDGHFVQIVTYSFSVQKNIFQCKQNLLVRDYFFQNLPVVSIQHRKTRGDIDMAIGHSDIYRFALDFLQQAQPYDLVHIAHPMRLTSFAEAAGDLEIPYVFTLTDFWTICPKVILQTSSGNLCAGPDNGEACSGFCPELKRDFIRSRLHLSRKLLDGAEAIVSPSRFLAAVFTKAFPELNIGIIPHGMDFQYLKLNTKKYQKNDSIVFAYCGGLSRHKGVHVLLEAFMGINTRNARLKLFGSYFQDKDYFDYLQKIACGNEKIQFCGSYTNEQVGDIYAGIDVLILPSLCYENYSLVLHEALACGVPVIASHVGLMAEKIKHAVNGFTFRVGDVKDLTHQLKRITDNPEILNTLKDSVKQLILPPVEEEAYLYDRLYQTVLRR